MLHGHPIETLPSVYLEEALDQAAGRDDGAALRAWLQRMATLTAVAPGCPRGGTGPARHSQRAAMSVPGG
jgi:hypothetical protein